MRITPVRAMAVLALASLSLVPMAARASMAAGDAGLYKIDTSHSNVTFRVRHLVSRVSGGFAKFSGTIDWDPAKPQAAKILAEIDANSIDTNHEKRDAHLKTDEFFDTANHPTITFQSTGVKVIDKSNYQMMGNLTMRGVTKPVTLDVEMLGTGPGPNGDTRMGFEARTKVNRKDYAINWNRTLDAGGVVLGDDVDIVLQIEAVKPKPEVAAPASQR